MQDGEEASMGNPLTLPQKWLRPSNDDSTLFLPLIDAPSYQLDNLPLLGVDLMDLFDINYPMMGAENTL